MYLLWVLSCVPASADRPGPTRPSPTRPSEQLRVKSTDSAVKSEDSSEYVDETLCTPIFLDSVLYSIFLIMK